MKKVAKMLATGVLGVLSLGMGMLSGCEWKWWQEEEPVYYGEEIAHTDWIMSMHIGLPDGEGLFRSAQELQQFWTENGYPTFEGDVVENPSDGRESENRELYQKMQSYDKAFFEEKALILDFFEEPNIYGDLYVKAVAIEEEGRLNVVTRYHSDGIAECALVYWVCFIEVDWSDVGKISLR